MALRRSKSHKPGPTGLVMSFALAVALVFGLWGSFTVVDTRKIGIATEFGRPTGQNFSNGLHFKPFWVNVSEMDAAIQYDSYSQASNNPLNVRLANNSIAAVDTSIRWRIQPDQADELFQEYKEFKWVKINLIQRNLQVVQNEIFQDFDPLANPEPIEPPTPGPSAGGRVSPDPVTPASGAVNLTKYSDEAETKLKGLVGTQVEILDISIAKLDYDDNTEGRLNELNTERTRTRIAEQQIQTATKERQAAEARVLDRAVPDIRIVLQDCINAAIADKRDAAGCWGQVGAGANPVFQVPPPR